MLFSCSVMSDYLWPHGLQHDKLPYPSLSLRVCSNSHPLNQWCHPTISSSVAPFSSCPQFVPASGYFPVSWFFTSGDQSIGASASTSVLPMNIQGWFPLENVDTLCQTLTAPSPSHKHWRTQSDHNATAPVTKHLQKTPRTPTQYHAAAQPNPSPQAP